MNKQNPLDHVRVVLSHTSHPGNIGAAARAMKTMGLSHLYLVNPKHFPDEQATAMASGADDILANAKVCASIDEALDGVGLTVAMTARLRDISVEVKTPREAMPAVLQAAQAQSVALLFGTEMSGLTNEELGKAQLLVNIPANPNYSSLNLAASVQVISYELVTAAELFQPEIAELMPAPHQQMESFYQHLEKTLYEIGFFTTQNPARLMQRLRRMFARARPESEEVNILRGILTLTTQYNGKLREQIKKEELK